MGLEAEVVRRKACLALLVVGDLVHIGKYAIEDKFLRPIITVNKDV